MTTEHALIELAYETRELARLREGILELLCGAFEAEVGLFAAIEGGREVRTLRGLRDEYRASLDSVWQETGREVQPVKEQALRSGAAIDRRVLGASLTRTKLFQCVMAPVGGTETLFLIPQLSGRALALVTLGRCGGHFSDAAVGDAMALIPALSVVCRAAASNPDPMPELTATELDLLDYLELGWGARHIAEARGTSFFTVRNQLSALYRKLEVANRAEAVGLRRAGLSAMGRSTHRRP
jgi:DNA-binding CsgD family transcriptional regulator